MTAADVAELDRYKKALDGMSLAELESRKAAAVANNEKAKTRLLIAEINQRHREEEAAQRRSTAATKTATDTRANLVREIRQAISVFALQDKQHRVTAQSQLLFSNHMEDFRARVLKLPPALRQGTQALFDQAKALAAGAVVHTKASGTVKLSGAALDEYKKKVAGMKDGDLKAALESEKKAKNLQKQSLILAELNRRADEKVKADQKNTASAAALSRNVQKLNEDFGLQVKQGKVSEQSLQNYRQNLKDAQISLEKLPPAYRNGRQALLTNGKALAEQGQNVVIRRQELDKLKESVVGWSLAELEAAKVRSGSDKAKLDLIDKQISKIKTLSDTQAEQAHNESLLSQAGADVAGIQAQYEARKTAAKGNLAELYQVELDFGKKLSDAQNAEANAQAAKDSAAVREKYDDLLKLAGISAERRRQLEADRDREVGAIEQRRIDAHAANIAAANNAEQQAKRSLDEAVLNIDRQTRDQIRQNNLEGLQRRTTDLEAALNEELSAEGLTEAQKFAIRERYEGQLVKAKQAEIKESRQIELQAERDRFDDAVAAASEKLGTTQAFLDTKTKLEAEHSSNVARINKRFDDDQRDYSLKLEQETARAKVSASKEFAGQQLQDAKQVAEEQTGNLSEMTASQRKAARDVLDIWRATYAALGDAGKDAVGEIDKALQNLTAADKKAREAAGKAIVDPQRISGDTASRLSRLSKPDDAQAASEQRHAMTSYLIA